MIENYPLYWPEGRPRTKFRIRSRFKQTFGAARDGMMAELSQLGAREVILSTNIPVRGDGLPYASAREPSDPAIAVYFNYKKRPMCFACDQYDLARDNIWAITLTIRAIRGIERWGSSDMMERAFRGFTALPEPSWKSVLELNGNATAASVEEAFRRLSHIHHPDKGGSPERFMALVKAREAALKELA